MDNYQYFFRTNEIKYFNNIEKKTNEISRFRTINEQNEKKSNAPISIQVKGSEFIYI